MAHRGDDDIGDFPSISNRLERLYGAPHVVPGMLKEWCVSRTGQDSAHVDLWTVADFLANALAQTMDPEFAGDVGTCIRLPNIGCSRTDVDENAATLFSKNPYR
jgi:hypothetical protein